VRRTVPPSAEIEEQIDQLLSGNSRLLAMQKVEGSNPFSRFAKGQHLQVFLVSPVGYRNRTRDQTRGTRRIRERLFAGKSDRSNRRPLARDCRRRTPARFIRPVVGVPMWTQRSGCSCCSGAAGLVDGAESCCLHHSARGRSRGHASGRGQGDPRRHPAQGERADPRATSEGDTRRAAGCLLGA
jgi:hypothetical protein